MIESLVKSRRYRDESEVVGDALRLVELRESEKSAKRDALRAAVKVGIDAIEQGQFRRFANIDDASAYLTNVTDDILEPAKDN